MDKYERQYFEGKCPYTEKPCYRGVPCSECEINEEEKSLYDDSESEEWKESRYDTLNGCNNTGNSPDSNSD